MNLRVFIKGRSNNMWYIWLNEFLFSISLDPFNPRNLESTYRFFFDFFISISAGIEISDVTPFSPIPLADSSLVYFFFFSFRNYQLLYLSVTCYLFGYKISVHFLFRTVSIQWSLFYSLHKYKSLCEFFFTFERHNINVHVYMYEYSTSCLRICRY